MLKIFLLIILLYLCYGIFPTIFFKFKYRVLRKNKGKTIYLTFDDGPSKYTAKLLKVLEKYNIKASFFCVANFANTHKDIMIKMNTNGHYIALHSLNHKNALIMSPLKTNKDFKESMKIMHDLNIPINYYRPPWGHLNIFSLFNIKKYHLKLMLWNVMAEDWEPNTNEWIITQKLLKRIQGNDIICLHDGRGKNNAPLKTIKALDKVIPILLSEGYIFKTVDEYEK